MGWQQQVAQHSSILYSPAPTLQHTHNRLDNLNKFHPMSKKMYCLIWLLLLKVLFYSDDTREYTSMRNFCDSTSRFLAVTTACKTCILKCVYNTCLSSKECHRFVCWAVLIFVAKREVTDLLTHLQLCNCASSVHTRGKCISNMKWNQELEGLAQKQNSQGQRQSHWNSFYYREHEGPRQEQ